MSEAAKLGRLEIVSAGRGCRACGSAVVRPVSLQGHGNELVIKVVCRPCGAPGHIIKCRSKLRRCPVCHGFLAADGSAISRDSFDWPSRCRHCNVAFDDGFPYRVRAYASDDQPGDQAFATYPDLRACISELERLGKKYIYRGPGWTAGALNVSAPFLGRRTAPTVNRDRATSGLEQ